MLHLASGIGQQPTAVIAEPARASALALKPATHLASADARAPGPTASAPPAPTDLLVELRLNETDRGPLFVKAAADGDFLVALDDLAQQGARPQGGRKAAIDGREYVFLRSIPGIQVTFDEKDLVLKVVLPASAFARKSIDLRTGSKPAAVRTHDTSAFLNYDAEYTQSGGDSARTLATEAGVRYGDWLFLHSAAFGQSGGASQDVRYLTQAIRDDRDNARRLTIGDAVASSGQLGGSFVLGGISFTKAYELDPYRVHQPTVSYGGVVTLPSDVDVYMGGVRIFSQRLAPGAFDLRNFAYSGGQRNVTVVLRDAFGNQQTVAFPYYFTDESLAAGLHDYGYFAGRLRTNYGAPDSGYGPFAASAFHRYGLNDHVTIGARGETSGGRFNAGPELTLRSDRLGVLSASFSASHDRGAHRNGTAAAAAYQYQAGALGARISAQRFSDDYAVADPLLLAGFPRREIDAGVSYSTPVLGSIDLDFSRTVPREGAETTGYGIGYSRTVFGRMNLFVQWRHTTPTPGNAVFVGLFYDPSPQHNVNIFQSNSPGSSSTVAQFGNTLGPGEGLGYRVALEHDRNGDEDSTRVNPYLQYNSRLATVIAETRDEVGSAASPTRFRRFAVQGALSWVGGSVALSRPITDSFALVRVSPPVAGVRVYQNSQEIGRTDSSGALLVPNIGSFLDNALSINDKDIPIDYTIDHVGTIVSPPYRSGSLVGFEVVRTRGLTAHLVLRAAGGLKPLEYHEGRLQVGGKEVAFPIGLAGEIYLENIPAGTYRGTVKLPNGACTFLLAAPEADAPVVEIREPVLCEPAH